MTTNPNHPSTEQNCFAEHINSALLIINRSFSAISQLFEGKVTNVTNYPYEKFNKIFEVRFDTATLSCTFDENNICSSSYLFLDNLEDLKHYIDYCDKTYTYNFRLNGWIIGTCCLRISPYKGDYFFVLLPLTKSGAFDSIPF